MVKGFWRRWVGGWDGRKVGGGSCITREQQGVKMWMLSRGEILRLLLGVVIKKRWSSWGWRQRRRGRTPSFAGQLFRPCDNGVPCPPPTLWFHSLLSDGTFTFSKVAAAITSAGLRPSTPQVGAKASLHSLTSRGCYRHILYVVMHELILLVKAKRSVA